MGGYNYLPSIDTMNDVVQQDEFQYEICPIKFSIGAILFKRELWNSMNLFKVTNGSDIGRDEAQLCSYCMFKDRAIVVSRNTIVGHLSFGPQNIAMKEYFENHKELFEIH